MMEMFWWLAGLYAPLPVIERKEKRMISLIAAMAPNRVIGKDNALPWPMIKEDMKWFRDNTRGKSVIMGRKTHESIGRLLPKRKNIIITRKLDYSVEGAIIVNSIEDAFAACENEPEIMVIGGEEIYELALPYVDRMYLTHICVHGPEQFDGDTYFPEFDKNEWEVKEEKICLQQENHTVCIFNILERK